MSLRDFLDRAQSTTGAVPDDVHDKTYYPKQGQLIRFDKAGEVYTMQSIGNPAPSDEDFPPGWRGAEFTYLSQGRTVDPTPAGHNYQDRERLFGVVELKTEDFYVWFFEGKDDAGDDVVKCAARNTSPSTAKNGGYIIDPKP